MGGLASVTGTVLVIVVIAGIVLSMTAIALGLFMLLSKGHAGEAEGEWSGKVKAKGPIGLFVFCVGVALLVIIMRQIILLGDGGAEPSTSMTTMSPLATGDSNTGATSTAGGAQVEFIFPPVGYEINAGDDVSGSVQVAGLGGDTLWIVSRHDDGGSYYLVSPPIAKDGYSSFLDESVGDSSDRGSSISYFAVLANAGCAQALSAIPGPFKTLPPSCTYRGQRVVRVR
jgi:hypothetical protein